MEQANGRNRLHIEQLGSLDTPMSGNDLIIVVDQYGVVEAEARNAAGNLPDLLGRVGAGIARIGSQRVGRAVFKVHFESSEVLNNQEETPLLDRLQSWE